MLNPKDNERLCQTGPDTPMGKMLREYWWPVLRTDRLVEDGEPVRVRLLGEDYVAFRDTLGRVGFLDEYCPHRRVSLVLARNEECGLRCLMHGWKIDVNGKVVDTPNEVEAGPRLDRIKVRHFPVREAGKMIWVYVGEKEPPAFPNFPFNDSHEIQPLIATVKCNWIQVMETLWDPAHVAILHLQGNTFKNAFDGADTNGGQFASQAISGGEVRDEPWGFSYRYANPHLPPSIVRQDWVPTVMPCWIFITGAGGVGMDADKIVFGHTPVDDETMLLWEIPYNLKKEFGDYGRVTSTAVGEEFHDFRLPNMERENNWGQDRDAMKNKGSFTGIGSNKGIQGVFCHDIAVAESMGRISNRSREFLGPADYAVVKGRHYYLEALRQYEATGKAPGVHDDLSKVGLDWESEPAE